MSDEVNQVVGSLKKKIVRIIINDENDQPKTFEIRELNGKKRDEYMKMIGAKVRYAPDGKPAGMKDTEGLSQGLLAMCLHEEGEKLPVSLGTLNDWPSSLIESTFEIAKKVSALNMDDAEQEGKA